MALCRSAGASGDSAMSSLVLNAGLQYLEGAIRALEGIAVHYDLEDVRAELAVIREVYERLQQRALSGIQSNEKANIKIPVEK